MLQLKAALRTGACVTVVGLGVWGLWFRLVLRRVSRTPRPWGPQWLAAGLSGLLHGFGCWYLRWTHNGEEMIKAGVWEQGKQYVIVWHPHGAFTITALYFISHWIPGLSEFLLLCNARSVESKSFDALLASGATVAVQPGGLREQVETDDQRERLFFPARLGFIRMALKHGTSLLPCYAFGENQLYRTASWTRRFNRWLLDNFGIGNLVILGQGGLPNSPVLPNPLMLPVFRRGLHLRFGEPVDLGPRNENPTDEQVEVAFQKYVAALRKLFDAHKDECLPPDVAVRGLEVVWPGHKKANGKMNGQIGSKKAD